MRDELMILLELQDFEYPLDVLICIKNFIRLKLEEDPSERCLRKFVRLFPIAIPNSYKHRIITMDVLEYRKSDTGTIQFITTTKLRYEQSGLSFCITFPGIINIDVHVKEVEW